MKQPNPLLPQGSFEAQARGKSHVRIAVFTILAIHVVVLGALLIQGCKRDDKDSSSSAVTNEVSPFGGGTDTFANPVEATPPLGSTPSNAAATPGTTSMPPSAPLAQTSNVAPLPVPTTVTPSPATPSPTAPAVAETSGADHTIVKGDTFAGLAQKYGVTVKAIQAANPGVDPAKLKLGQKVKIPGKSATAATTTSTSNGGGSSSEVYVVKSGDTLQKIAKEHTTTVKAIQRQNNLSTTQIKVGQKLKLPSRATAPATATPNPATPGGAPPTGGTLPPAPAQ